MIVETQIQAHFKKAFILTFIGSFIAILPLALLFKPIFNNTTLFRHLIFYMVSGALYLYSIHNHFVNEHEGNLFFILSSIIAFFRPFYILDWLIVITTMYKTGVRFRQKKHLTFISTKGLFNHFLLMLPTMRMNILCNLKDLFISTTATVFLYRIVILSILCKFNIRNTFSILKIMIYLRFYLDIALLIFTYVIYMEIMEIIYIYNISMPFYHNVASLSDKNVNESRFIGFQSLRLFNEYGTNAIILRDYLTFELKNLNQLIKKIEHKLTFDPKMKRKDAPIRVERELGEYIYSVGILLNIWKVIKKRREYAEDIISGDNLMMLRYLKDKCVKLENLYTLGMNTQIYGELEVLK